MDPIVVSSQVFVPASALSWKAVRSGGPGGQNVNKVASKVELYVDLGQVVGLNFAQAQRLRQLSMARVDADGRLRITSQTTRDQSRNLEIAREKVQALVSQALVVPRRRVATRPTKGSKERRLEHKKRASERKRNRSWRPD